MSNPPSVVISSRLLGHQRGLIGPYVTGDLQDFGLAGHLQIQFYGDGLPQNPQIAFGDVAAVLAEVQCDAVGSGQFGQGSRPDGVRLVGPPRLPNGGHVIDIDAELRHRRDYSRSAAMR